MVRLAGFEPATHCLEGSCSIQLSYKRALSVVEKDCPVVKKNFCLPFEPAFYFHAETAAEETDEDTGKEGRNDGAFPQSVDFSKTEPAK